MSMFINTNWALSLASLHFFPWEEREITRTNHITSEILVASRSLLLAHGKKSYQRAVSLCLSVCLAFIKQIIGIDWHCVCLPVKCVEKWGREKKSEKRQSNKGRKDQTKSRIPLLTELIRDIRRRMKTRQPCQRLNSIDDVPDFRVLPWWLTSSLSPVNYCGRAAKGEGEREKRELLISLNEYNHNIWWPSSVERCRQTPARSDTKKPQYSAGQALTHSLSLEQMN